MRIEEYTPDAICRAMGLEAFADDPVLSRGDESLRVLLAPSFDPEVCLTVWLGGEKANVEARALARMFSHISAAAAEPQSFLQTAVLPRAAFDENAGSFRDGIEAMKEEAKKGVVLDGMNTHVILRSKSDAIEFGANVGTCGILNEFVASLLRRAHAGLAVGECRNALAAAGRYVGAKLALNKLAIPPDVSRVLVLGEADQRKELMDRLAERASPAAREGDSP